MVSLRNLLSFGRCWRSPSARASPPLSRRGFLGALAVLPLLAGRAAWAQQRARPGYEYLTIDPQPVASSGIEVAEFFWYGCPYCYQLQGPLETWLQTKPADVTLRRIPAIFRESWVPHARLYYTLEALGELPRLHQSVYRSMHEERQSLNSAEATAEWAKQHGIDAARWLGTYNSPEIDRKIDDSRRFTRSYAIKGTPSLVIDGRFVTSSGMTETVAGVIPILEDLIKLAREQRATR
jgi:thiol:disulfide interchange protein DsbA